MSEFFGKKSDILRQKAKFFVILIGFLSLFSSLLINPWIGKYWRRVPIINVYDVMLEYFIWSLLLGTTFVIMGFLVSNNSFRKFDNIIILFLVISKVF